MSKKLEAYRTFGGTTGSASTVLEASPRAEQIGEINSAIQPRLNSASYTPGAISAPGGVRKNVL